MKLDKQIKHQSNTPPVPFPDFDRISRSILGLLIAENANITTSCLFFGLIGESILNKHYNLKAKAVVGFASYNLGVSQLIAFANPTDGESVSFGEANFHCWVEVNGWFLDFSAIIFPEIAFSIGGKTCPRFMFQKPLAKSSVSLFELQTQGSFHCLPDNALTVRKIEDFRAAQAYVDLINICTDWYTKPQKPMKPICIKDNHGNTKAAIISPVKLDGVWL